MAKMYPEDIEGYEEATEGEKRVFRFLREAAKPHNDFTCWYQPTIGSSGKEPDFILFGKNFGLLVVEVKDWFAQQIVSYNPHQFTLLTSGEEQKTTNPDKQAKSYVNALKEWLREMPEYRSEHREHKGQLKIPIGRMLAFTEIPRAEYAESQFKWFIDSERVLFMEDLDPVGDILHDASGRKFQEKIAKAFPFPFAGLTPKEMENLAFILWPERKIHLPPRQGAGKARFQKETLALDEDQAKLSLRLPSGHQIIKGPPGVERPSYWYIGVAICTDTILT